VKKELESYKKFETSPENYFSIGATKDDVKSIMGVPSRIYKYITGDEEEWNYDLSSIHFKNGKVIDYSNTSKNLRVK